MECSDDECNNYRKDDDQLTKYIKLEYEKIVKNFTVKKAQEIK